MTYEVLRCADGHYRRLVYSLGPYIADYPEQVLLACTVQGWCTRYSFVSPLLVHCDAHVSGSRRRCTAIPSDLDTGQAPRRSHEHTEALLNVMTARRLWDDYGVVGDLVVSPVSFHMLRRPCLRTSLTMSVQPFTSYFPRADIHELLSPDLLHQVIKGSFKDHLVTWVEEYLIQTHGKSGAAVVMADIDRR